MNMIATSQLVLAEIETRVQQHRVTRRGAGIAGAERKGGGSPASASPLLRLGPNLAELAVSVLVDDRGGFHREARTGLMLQGLLAGIELFDVAEPAWDSVVVDLFKEGLDFIRRHRDAPVQAEQAAQILRWVAGALAGNLAGRVRAGLLAGEPDQVKAAGRYAGLVLWSVLNRGLELAVEQTGWAAGSGKGEAGLLREVALAFLGLLLEETGLRATLRVVANRRVFERLVFGMLKVGAEYPGFFSGAGDSVERWLRQLLGDLAEPFKDGSVLEPGAWAEAAAVLLERGLLDLPGLARNPSNKRYYLVTALRDLLEGATRAEGAPGQRVWHWGLSSVEARQLLESVVGAWAAHPEWILQRAGHQEKAATLLPLLAQAIGERDSGSLKALLRTQKLQAVLGSVLVSGLSGRLSSFKPNKISAIIDQVLNELALGGFAGWRFLLENSRLTDLLTAISASKVADRLFGEDEEAAGQAARVVALVAQELRFGQILSLAEMVERLNKGR